MMVVLAHESKYYITLYYMILPSRYVLQPRNCIFCSLIYLSDAQTFTFKPCPVAQGLEVIEGIKISLYCVLGRQWRGAAQIMDFMKSIFADEVVTCGLFEDLLVETIGWISADNARLLFLSS